MQVFIGVLGDVAMASDEHGRTTLVTQFNKRIKFNFLVLQHRDMRSLQRLLGPENSC